MGGERDGGRRWLCSVFRCAVGGGPYLQDAAVAEASSAVQPVGESITAGVLPVGIFGYVAAEVAAQEPEVEAVELAVEQPCQLAYEGSEEESGGEDQGLDEGQTGAAPGEAFEDADDAGG